MEKICLALRLISWKRDLIPLHSDVLQESFKFITETPSRLWWALCFES